MIREVRKVVNTHPPVSEFDPERATN